MTLFKTVVAPFLILFLILSSCNTKEAGLKSKNVVKDLPVIKLITLDTVIYKEYVADIHAVKNVEIRARVEGFLDKIYVDEGKNVQKGQPLFKLNSEEFEAELAKQKANLKSAIANAKASKLEVDRISILVEKDVISNSELEVAKAKLTAAEARVDEAQSAQSNAAIQLSYTHLKSPFNGLISRIPLKKGSLVSAGTLLTKISDNSSINAYFNVSEGEYLGYQKMLKNEGIDKNKRYVTLTLADGTIYPHKGVIETTEGEINSSTGTIAFRAKFPNPDRLLKHGSTGKITLSRSVRDALLVPQKAAFEIQDKLFVYVLDQNNKVSIRSFEPENRLSHFYIVSNGLQPHDKVIYEGIQNLKEGATVNPIFYTMDTLIKAASEGKTTIKNPS